MVPETFAKSGQVTLKVKISSRGFWKHGQGVFLGNPPWHGLSTEPVPVSAYVGSSKNLKDLKDLLTGKHWDRGLTAGQRRAVAVRTLAELEEELAALVASGGSGDVVQAFPVG